MLKDQVLEHLWKARDEYISGAELAGRLDSPFFEVGPETDGVLVPEFQ